MVKKRESKRNTENDGIRSSGGSGAYPSTSTTHPSSATTETCRTASLEAEVQTTTKVEVESQVETRTDTRTGTTQTGQKGESQDDTEGDSTRSSGGSGLYPSIGISTPVPLSSGYSTYGMFGECSSSSSAGSYHSPNTPYASMGPSFSSDATRQVEEELVTKVMQESKAEYEQQQRGYYEAYGHSTSATETQYASSIPPEEKQTFELGRVEVITEQEERTPAVRQEVEVSSSANAGGDDGSRGNEVEAASAGGGGQSGGGNGGGSGGGSGGGNGGGGDRPPSRPPTPPKDDPGDKKEKKEDKDSKEAKKEPPESSSHSNSKKGSESNNDQSADVRSPSSTLFGFDYKEEDVVPSGSVGDTRPWTKTARIKAAKLPREGKMRFIPEDNYHPSVPLRRGPNGGYMDKFNNEWRKGESRTKGEDFEWDIQLSSKGRKQLGHLSRDGQHLNVSLKGRITH